MSNNELIIIPKTEKYIEYMLTVLLKLPRTEKFSIGTEIKTSIYSMLKNILLSTKVDKSKRLEIYMIKIYRLKNYWMHIKKLVGGSRKNNNNNPAFDVNNNNYNTNNKINNTVPLVVL